MKALALTLLVLPAIALGQSEGTRLIEKVRDLHRADTAYTEYRVSIVRPDWQRDLVLNVHEDQRAGLYAAEVVAPRKLNGTQFLKADGRLWMYMPKLKRRVGISPSMMLEPWMGSDLTNQDLLQADAIADAYTHEIVHSEEVDGHTVHTIRSTPRDSAAVVWGRLEQRIRDDGVPLEVTYFDRDGEPARRITFSEPRDFDGRTLPSRWRVTPVPASGSYTEVEVTEARFNLPLTEGAFAHIAESAKKNDS